MTYLVFCCISQCECLPSGLCEEREKHGLSNYKTGFLKDFQILILQENV